MFTIKVTYRAQTRKATFQDLDSFPTFTQICVEVSQSARIPEWLLITIFRSIGCFPLPRGSLYPDSSSLQMR
jgi:hypothetical protein